MDFSRYLRFYDSAEKLLVFGEAWGVYQFPDGQNQIWFKQDPTFEEVCLNHPAILDLVGQALLVAGPLNVYVTYLYGARSDKVLSGDRRVPNVALSSRDLVQRASLGKKLEILMPHDSPLDAAPISFFPDLSGYDGVVFPDASAKMRQPWLLESGLPEITFEKVRDQVTGEIVGHHPNRSVSGGRLLVTDDICDGGATFVKVAEMLPDCELDLSVTHGIFSGAALERLTSAGYRKIYTTNSFVQHDPDREKLIESRCEVANVWRPNHG